MTDAGRERDAEDASPGVAEPVPHPVSTPSFGALLMESGLEPEDLPERKKRLRENGF